MRICLGLLPLLMCVPSRAQRQVFARGEVIDSVPVQGSTTESFALYLPEQYRPGSAWPIVLIFDPAARGGVAVRQFTEVAETYGYILVASNDSRNGPYDRNFEITNRLFNEVFSDFDLDPGRIYTAGFSGGARLASSIAVLSGHIQGVVACGAGFSDTPPSLNPPFSYAAIVGDRDFNYSELRKTDGWLEKLQLPHELFVFGIEHQWPLPEQLGKAFAWLQLEAFRKELLPENKAVVDRIYSKFYDDARKLEAGNDLPGAVREYDRIFRNFGRYYGVDSIRVRAESIRETKAFRTQKQELEKSLEVEAGLVKMYVDALQADIRNGVTETGQWDKRIARIREKMAGADLYNRAMFGRILATLSAIAFETADHGSGKLSVQQKIFCYDICILANPENLYSYLRQMENYLALGKRDRAFEYLEKLVRSGFQDRAYLKENSTVSKLKDHPGFNALMEE